MFVILHETNPETLCMTHVHTYKSYGFLFYYFLQGDWILDSTYSKYCIGTLYTRTGYILRTSIDCVPILYSVQYLVVLYMYSIELVEYVDHIMYILCKFTVHTRSYYMYLYILLYSLL